MGCDQSSSVLLTTASGALAFAIAQCASDAAGGVQRNALIATAWKKSADTHRDSLVAAVRAAVGPLDAAAQRLAPASCPAGAVLH